MRWSKLLLSVMVLVSLLFGCGSFVTGSGKPAEETRTVPSFTSIEVDDSIDATITVGPAFSVRLRTDDNVMPLVRTSVEGGRLVARLPDTTNVSTDLGIELDITLPALDGVVASGAAHVVVTGVAAPKLVVEASGASKVSASGTAADLSVSASGSSTVALAQTSVDRAVLDVSGPSDVTIRASTWVRGQASGGSRIHVRGNAATRDLDLSGGSTMDVAP